MGIDMTVDVDGKSVVDEIERRIERGIKNSMSATKETSVPNQMKDLATRRIHKAGAVWTEELVTSFKIVSDGDSAVLMNTADHASFQEHGVSGTERRRDTPHTYTDSPPPIESLIPWVRAHLV